MVRVGDAVSAAATAVGLTVTRVLSYSEKNGIPPLNVLYTSDEDQAWYFLRNRLNSSVLGLDMQWKPVLKGKPTSRSSLLQIAAGDWVLIYDVLPTPWYGTPAQPLSERMCEFLQEKGRTFYGMILPVDAARIAFELDCVISRGVDLRKNPWRGANTTGGMVHLGNQILKTSVREDRKVAISNWEWRPLTGQQLRFMAEKTYLSWAIANHFLKKKGRPSKEAVVKTAQIYGAGSRLRKAGLVLEETKHDWTKAKKQWIKEVKLRKEEAEAAEAAAAEEAKAAEKKEKKRRAREAKVAAAAAKTSSSKGSSVAKAASSKKSSSKGSSAAGKKKAADASKSEATEKRSVREKSRKSRQASTAPRDLVEDVAKVKKSDSKKKTKKVAAPASKEKASTSSKSEKQTAAGRKTRRKQTALAASS